MESGIPHYFTPADSCNRQKLYTLHKLWQDWLSKHGAAEQHDV